MLLYQIQKGSFMSNQFTPEAIRAEFPSLSNIDNGLTPIYFDNPGGTQVHQSVIDAVSNYYLTSNSNKGGAFLTSRRTDETVHDARAAMADLLNARSPSEIVFGPNMTTLTFAFSRALGKRLKPGDEIVLTRLDHDANIAPWLMLADDLGVTVRWVEINTDDCTLNLDSYEAALSDHTRLVAIGHASNAVGTINPLKPLIEMAHAAGAWTFVDAVQSTPHIDVDVQALDADFLACSAYKFFGPHIGVLYGKFDLLESLPAYRVRPAPQATPEKWETGTKSFETLAGTTAAVRYLSGLGIRFGQTEQLPERAAIRAGMSIVAEYEQHLARYLIDGLKAIPGITVRGITDPARMAERVPTVAFALDGHSPRAVAEYLGNQAIYVWSGNYYAQEIMQALDYPEGMVRVGLAHYNTRSEVERLLNVLGSL